MSRSCYGLLRALPGFDHQILAHWPFFRFGSTPPLPRPSPQFGAGHPDYETLGTDGTLPFAPPPPLVLPSEHAEALTTTSTSACVFLPTSTAQATAPTIGRGEARGATAGAGENAV